MAGVCTRVIQLPESHVNALAITKDKKLLAVAGNPHVKVFEIASEKSNPIHVFDGHSGNVVSTGFQKDSKWLYTGSDDGTIRLWDIRTPRCQRHYSNPSPINSVVLHPNQGELVSCDQNGSFKVWDLGGNVCSHELLPEENVAARSVTISGDGNTLVGATNSGNCYIWKYSAGSFVPHDSVQAHERYITKCLLSPNGKRLATASAEKTAKIWEMEELKLEQTLTGHTEWVWDCAFTADSAYIITASSDMVPRLWDISTGETMRFYSAHQKAVTSIALNDLSF